MTGRRRAPGPLSDTAVVRVGGARVRRRGPGSAGVLLRSAPPAAHSPDAAPEAVLVFADVIASRSVHRPSLAAVSERELTVIPVGVGVGVGVAAAGAA